MQDHTRAVIKIGLASFEQLSGLVAVLRQKVHGRVPSLDAVHLDKVFALDTLQNGFNVQLRFVQRFDAHNTLEDTLHVTVTPRVHYTRAVDEEYPLKERDVLPHFGLSGNRSGRADLFVS